MPSRAKHWSRSEAAVLRTVLYASVFEYPLTLAEVRRTLLRSSMSESEILQTYEQSWALRAAVEYRNGLFFPRGRAGWIPRRRRRTVRSLALLQRHRRLLRTIAALPFVRLVALSGSIAALNADRRADLDLFLVVRGARVWMLTLVIVLLARLARCRDVVCLNFILSDERLVLEQQDMFAANQIVQLRPVFGLDGYGRFLAANPFVYVHYPNFTPLPAGPVAVELGAWARRSKAAAEFVLALPSRAIESLSRAIYGWHLRRRARTCASPAEVRLDVGCLKLHMRSHRTRVLRQFRRRCARALRARGPGWTAPYVAASGATTSSSRSSSSVRR